MPEVNTVCVLAYDRCGEQDTLVPYEIMKHAAMVVAQQQPGRTVSVRLLRPDADVADPVGMQMGTKVLTDGVVQPGELFDLLLVPGGMGSGDASRDTAILEIVRRHHAAGKVVATNCSGISVLHRAGILGSTPVTAAATVSRRLTEEGANMLMPRTMWAGGEANIWTSAGGSGVHGSTVAMIAHYFGRAVGEFISMGWDTRPALGDAVFELRGPEYLSYPEGEAMIQDALEDILLPRAN